MQAPLDFARDERDRQLSIPPNSRRCGPGWPITTACVIHDPSGAVVNHPTNVTWGGPDLRDLYIGSIRADYVLKARSPVAGQPLVHQL